MSILPMLAAVLSLTVQDPPVPGAAMADRVAAQSQHASVEGCDQSVREAEIRNAEGLFVGSAICSQVGREDDAVFLLLAAQSRAMADMALTMPEGLPEPDADGVVDMSAVPEPPFEVIDLYAFIYAYGGGAGPDELYRDARRTEALFDRLKTWTPLRPDGYDPGWTGSRIVTDQTYAESIRTNVNYRIDQLAPLAVLLRDETYYAVNQEAEALRLANNGRFVVGTPEYEQHSALMDAMNARRRELGFDD